MHMQAPANMGLSSDDVAVIQNATTSAWAQMLDALLPVNGYNWQAFGDQDGVSPSVSQGNCASIMNEYCSSEQYAAPKLLDMGGESTIEQVDEIFSSECHIFI